MGVSVVQALFSLHFSYMGCFYHMQHNGLLAHCGRLWAHAWFKD